MPKANTVDQVGERGLLRRLARILDPAPSGELGIGDDTALIAARRGPWLFTTDAMVEGTHFRRAWFRPGDVGFKALAANLSDAAAMGGRPTHALVSLVLPGTIPVAAVEGLYRGMRRLARREGVALLGGNIARGEMLAISISLLGDFPWGNPVRRTGARAGDRIYVTGRPGLAYLGLRLLERSKPSARTGSRPGARGGSGRDPWNRPVSAEPVWRRKIAERSFGARAALRRFLTPDPRTEAAHVLQDLRPTALIDVSDGLGSDLRHLAGIGRRLVVDCRRLPRTPALDRLAAEFGLTVAEAALHGGEDYELLFTLKRETAEGVGPKLRLAGLAAVEVGRVERGPAGIFLEDDGGFEPLNSKGFKHFKDS